MHREIAEEVGLQVRTLEYLGSQPWPFPASLMLCYKAHAIGHEFKVDDIEIEHALWVTRDELRDMVAAKDLLLPSRVSIARKAIEHWYGEPLLRD